MYVASESKDSHGLGHLDVTIKIFEKLQESAKVGRLNSYFLPFLDIFSFANTHVRLIPEEDLEETLINVREYRRGNHPEKSATYGSKNEYHL
jgi:hypothetical protein